MKTERKILLFSVILGLAVWVANTVSDYLVFHPKNTFWELLFLRPNPDEIYLRLLILAAFLLFGVVSARALAGRRRTQELLSASENNLAITLQSVADAVIATDPEGRISLINPPASRLTGWSAEAAVGRRLDDVFHVVEERTGEQLDSPIQPVLREGTIGSPVDNAILIGRDGTRRLIEQSAAPISDKVGRVIGAVLVFRDVAERRQTVEALRREKELAQKYLSIAGAIIVALDAQGKVTLINRKGCELLGLPEADILGKNWFDHFVPERLRQPVHDVFARTMAGEVPVTTVDYYENPVVSGTGKERIIGWRNTVVTDEHGAIAGTLSSGEDITDRLQAFASLQQGEERFRAVLAAAEDCIFIKDRELRFTHINPSMERLLGITASEVVGRPAVGQAEIGMGEHVHETDNRVLKGETIEEEITRPINGVATTFHLIKMPIRDSSGAITALCGIARNITHRKRSEDALRDSEARLQHQNAALAKLDMRHLLSGGDLLAAVRKIGETAAGALHVERLGVWLFTDDRSKIRCIDQYERSKESHTNGVELVVDEYPTYFRTLDVNHVIATVNALIDPRTSEFAATHLIPLGITSTLEAPVRVGGHIAGVVCCEHVGPQRQWTLDEQNFAGSMADLVALALQVSERNRAQEALRESEEKYRCLVERANDGIAIVQDGRLVYVNPRLAETIGYAVEEVIGTPYEDHIYPDEREEIRARYNRRMAGQALPPIHHTALRHRDGRRIEVELNAGVITYRGAPADFVFVRDISERRRAADAVRESEQLLRAIVEATQEAIISIGEDGNITLFNPAAEQMFGRARANMIGRSLDCLMPEEYRTPHHNHVSSYFATGKPDSAIGGMLELPGLRSDGTVFPMEISLSVGRHGNQRVVTAVARDISARKQALETIRRERERAIKILEALDDGIYIVSPDYTVEYANPALVRQFGPFEGRKCYEYCDGREAVCPWCKLNEARAGNTARWTWHSSRTGKTFRVLTAPVSELDGSRLVLVVLTDVTEFDRRDQTVRQTRQLVEQIFRESLDVILIIGEDGEVHRASEAVRSILGFDADKLVGVNIARFLPPQGNESPEEFLAKLRVYGGIFEAQSILRADGTTCRMDVTATVIPWGRGKAILATLRDVSERHANNQQEREREQEYRELYENAPLAYQSLDEEGRLIAVNRAWVETLGYSREQVIGRWFGEFLAPECVDRFRSGFAHFQQAGELHGAEFEIIRKDGSRINVLFDGRAAYNNAGKFRRTHCIMRDISERRRNEQVKSALFEIAEATTLTDNLPDLLKQIRQVLGRLIDTTNFYVALYDPEHDQYRFPYYVDQYDSIDFTPQQLKRSLTDYVRRAGKPLLVDEHVHRELEERGEVELVGQPSPIWLGAPLNTMQGTIGVVVVQSYTDPNCYTIADLELLTFVSGHIAMAIERKRAEEALRESQRTLCTLMSNLPGMVYRCRNDHDWTMEFVSEGCRALTGYDAEDLVGNRKLSYNDLIHPQDQESVWNQVQQAVRENRPFQLLYRIIAAAGEERWVTEQGRGISGPDGELLALEGFIADVTRRRHAEQALHDSEELLRQSQKMEAVGRLAGGVAHDFNNLLSIITGHSELLLPRVAADDRLLHHVQEINEAGQRAANLTRQLLAFSRKQVLEPKVLSLNAIVANMDKMLRRLIGEDISLTTVSDPELGAVRADPGQIEQVLMNLVVNARDAMPRGGKITVETANVELGDAFAHEHPDVAAGHYVMLSVSDTGHGMDNEVKAHIFEPFFTTKGAGKGTGLGLSTVYGIVKQSDGHILADSEPGMGTSFRIYLPQVEAPVGIRHDECAHEPAPRGNETILVVEDELGVRDLVCDALRAQGYEVISADDGVAALQLSDQHSGPVHLLMTDVVMPLMSGLDLAEHLARKRREMKVMYLSGYTDHNVVQTGAAGQSGAFLQKPFTLDHLCRMVRTVLDGKPEAIHQTMSETPADS